MKKELIRLQTKLITIVCFIALIFLTVNTRIFAQENSNEPITSVKCNEFTFDATGSHDPDNENISFYWDFGDGNSSNDPTVIHSFEKSGDYLVTLAITDNSGLQCSTARTSQLVRVNIPPFASFSAIEKVCVNSPVILDATASYDDSKNKMSYVWDFGDGTGETENKRVTKSYAKGGNYTVSLVVDDNSKTVCSSHTTQKIIQVNEPPVAIGGEKTILKCVNQDDDMTISFDASKSNDINNDPLTYQWEFGDGQKADGALVSHKYGQTGYYRAKLIVNDNSQLSCGSSIDYVNVRLDRAHQVDAGEDIVACPDENVMFDGLVSENLNKSKLETKWNFGDGNTVNGNTLEHSYSNPGKYQAVFELNNLSNTMCPASTDIRNVTINAMPSVSIKADRSACLGNAINLDASSATDPDGDSLEYYWSFGDGTILRAGSKVSHEYKQGGNYRVTVIVDDGKNSSCSTTTANASIKINTPPVADIGANTSCCVGKREIFDASASSDPDGDTLTYNWDFGDGSNAKGMQAEHVYTKSGSFNVSLTIDDNSGTACSTSTTGFTAKVNAKPVPVINVR